jgi:hypothetical protein
MQMTAERKLQIQFTKALRKGFIKNAQMHPTVPEIVVQYVEDEERITVRVDARTGHTYWFTDRRVLLQTESSLCQVFRYDEVKRVHWMAKDRFHTANPIAMKRNHYDRLVLETGQSEVVLEGLEQAYVPTLSFLQWIMPS